MLMLTIVQSSDLERLCRRWASLFETAGKACSSLPAVLGPCPTFGVLVLGCETTSKCVAEKRLEEGMEMVPLWLLTRNKVAY